MAWYCNPPAAIPPQTPFNLALRLVDNDLVPLYAPGGALPDPETLRVCPQPDALNASAGASLTVAGAVGGSSDFVAPSAALYALVDAVGALPTRDTSLLDSASTCST